MAGLRSNTFRPLIDYYVSRGIAGGLYGVGWISDDPPMACLVVRDASVEVPHEVNGVTILAEEVGLAL